MKQNLNSWDYNNFKNQKFDLPKIKCNFEVKTNPNIQIKEDQEKWIMELFNNSKEKSKKYLSQQTFLIYTYSFPFATSEELKCIFKIMDWAFIIDDFYFESRMKGLSYLQELFGYQNMVDESEINSEKLLSKDKFIKIFWEIIAEYKSINNSNNFKSINVLIKEIDYWAKSAIQCNENELSINSNSTLNDYIKYRYYDIGIIMALASSTTLLEIPDEIRESKLFKQLEYCFVYCNTLINDCFSFKKEKNDSLLTNYIKIKTLQCGSIQSSLDSIAQSCENSLQEIENLSNQLINLYPLNNDLKQYIKQLQCLTSGHLYVSSICNRYK